MRQHLPYLHGLAVRLCGDRERAEDVVQDALLRAFRAFPQLRNRQRPRVWLTRVLRSCFHDDLRKDPPRSQPQGVDDDAPFDLFDTIAEEDPFPHSDRVHLDFLELFDDVRIIEVLSITRTSCRGRCSARSPARLSGPSWPVCPADADNWSAVCGSMRNRWGCSGERRSSHDQVQRGSGSPVGVP